MQIEQFLTRKSISNLREDQCFEYSFDDGEQLAIRMSGHYTVKEMRWCAAALEEVQREYERQRNKFGFPQFDQDGRRITTEVVIHEIDRKRRYRAIIWMTEEEAKKFRSTDAPQIHWIIESKSVWDLRQMVQSCNPKYVPGYDKC